MEEADSKMGCWSWVTGRQLAVTPVCGGRWSPDCPWRGQCCVSRTCSGGAGLLCRRKVGTTSKALGALAKLSKLETIRPLMGLSVHWRKMTHGQGVNISQAFPEGAGQLAELTRPTAWLPQDQPPEEVGCPVLRWVGLLCRCKVEMD